MIAALLPAILPILGSVLDKAIPDPEAREKAKADMARMHMDGSLRELEIQMSAIVMEARSADPWTSRARPSFLYVMYAVIGLCFAGGIVGIWWPEQVTTAAQNIANLLGAIPEEMWWLFGAGYLGYTGARSFDKAKR